MLYDCPGECSPVVGGRGQGGGRPGEKGAGQSTGGGRRGGGEREKWETN